MQAKKLLSIILAGVTAAGLLAGCSSSTSDSWDGSGSQENAADGQNSTAQTMLLTRVPVRGTYLWFTILQREIPRKWQTILQTPQAETYLKLSRRNRTRTMI